MHGENELMLGYTRHGNELVLRPSCWVGERDGTLQRRSFWPACMHRPQAPPYPSHALYRRQYSWEIPGLACGYSKTFRVHTPLRASRESCESRLQGVNSGLARKKIGGSDAPGEGEEDEELPGLAADSRKRTLCPACKPIRGVQVGDPVVMVGAEVWVSGCELNMFIAFMGAWYP